MDLDKKLDLCFARIRETASGLDDDSQRFEFLDLIPPYIDGIANMDIIGQKGKAPVSPFKIPVKGSRQLEIMCETIAGQRPTTEKKSSTFKCPACNTVLKVSN